MDMESNFVGVDVMADELELLEHSPPAFTSTPSTASTAASTPLIFTSAGSTSNKAKTGSRTENDKDGGEGAGGAKKDMASTMKIKFDKYWSDYSIILALGCVLDPMAKLQFLNFVYRKLYPNNYQEKVNKVREALYKLFGEYEISSSMSSQASSSRVGQSMPTSMLDEYHQELKRMASNDGKSEIDIYLEDVCIGGNDVNVLEYWKVNKHRFPQLSIMACDVLSIPITTVASESSFSIGGRILHKYRSCLLPENVQALICTRNWLHGFKEVGHSELQDSEEIRMSEEDSNTTNEMNHDECVWDRFKD